MDTDEMRSLADCDARAGEPLGKALREAADELDMWRSRRWQTMRSAPTTGGPFLAALRVYGSPHHPTKPREFLRWDYAIIEPGETGELDCGWSVEDFEWWAPIKAPHLPLSKDAASPQMQGRAGT